jgi:hypothetical protein
METRVIPAYPTSANHPHLSWPHRDLALLLIAALLSFSMWYFVDRIWAPPSDIHYSDLYPRWYGAQQLLLHNRDPYSAAVTNEIQIWSYGQVVDQTSPSQDEDRFAYPLYVVLLLAPTVRLPFDTVQVIFRYLNLLFAFAMILAWLRFVRWRSSSGILGAIVLLSFTSFPILESLYLQQPVVFAVLCLALAAAAIRNGWFIIGGMFFSLATIKPQLVPLLTVWLLVWAVSEWKSRKGLLIGMGLTMSVLLGTAQYLVPTWIPEWIAGLGAYQRYTKNSSILEVLLTHGIAIPVSIVLIVAAGVLAWKARHAPADSERFVFIFCLLLIVTVVVIPTIYPTGQLVILPSLYWSLKYSREAMARGGKSTRLGFVALWSLFSWPFVSSLLMLLANLFVPLSSLRRMWLVPVSTLLLVPLSALVLFGLLVANHAFSDRTQRAT